jgi:uncharacterized protein (DUF2126 family)
MRDERMYLVPGDSAMGYRLPLDSLPWVSKADHPYHIEHDPFAPSHALKSHAQLKQQHQQNPVDQPARNGKGFAASNDAYPSFNQSAAWITRTALCVEVRNPGRASGPKAEFASKDVGVIYVFMPPLQLLDDYLELVTAIKSSSNHGRLPTTQRFSLKNVTSNT